MLQELKNKGSLLFPKEHSRTHPAGRSAQKFRSFFVERLPKQLQVLTHKNAKGEYSGNNLNIEMTV